MSTLLGYNVHAASLESIDLSKTKTINTINPHSYCIAKKDKVFMEALKQSDVLLPDGIGIVWAELFLNGNSIKKIAGYDVFVFLMQYVNSISGCCFFLGASEETLKKIEDKIKLDYPNINVGSYSPPYKAEFTEEDSFLMCEKVNLLKPSVLFVGMTAPKQEKWVHENKQSLDAEIICSIGAVFDFYAGNVSRAPKILVKLGLEWVHRSFKSRRLLKRNMVSNPKFVFEVFKSKFNK